MIATCGPNDIRLWNVARSDELLRIAVPNLECLCVVFSHDGGALLSGWDDGKVRAFGPGTPLVFLSKGGGGQNGDVIVWYPG